MNILLVGGGGREHAIIQKLRENPEVATIWALPGNGGIARHAECVDIAATDIDGIVRFAKEHPVDFAVVAPDDPLAMGAVDRLGEIGLPCFGPTKAAAAIEASKVFSKNLMRKYGIPTAEYEVFTDCAEAIEYLKGAKYPLVVKADGLALGKGVLICEDEAAAKEAVRDMLEGNRFGESGHRVVIEEYMTGPEVSVLAFTDGIAMKPMVSSMDHKRALDNDEGLNTGGMGAVAPNPLYTEEIAARCMREIFLPTMEAMNREGRAFKGCLYFGLMLTPEGPKVVEYNCRFGDPEAQVVLPLLKTDLLAIFRAVAEERLSEIEIEWEDAAACCVVVASGGYPAAYKKGCPVDIGVDDSYENTYVYHAGTKLRSGALVTSGGRVIGVTGVADDLPEAIWRAYRAAAAIRFEDAYYRRDIGKRALRGED